MQDNGQKIFSRIKLFIMGVLIFWFVISHSVHLTSGLADNGDFSRSIRWMSDGAYGFEENVPEKGSEERRLRFFKYWLPDWNQEWDLSEFSGAQTSTAYIWLLGGGLNYLLYSTQVLFLPIISLIPRLITFGILLLFFKWINQQKSRGLFFLISMGIPLTLLFTSSDYISFFNSFYQEVGSFIYLFLFIASLFILKKKPNAVNLGLSVLLLVLLTSAKSSNIYWAFLAPPVIVIFWSMGKNLQIWKNISLIVFIIAVTAAVSIDITGFTKRFTSLPYNQFHSYFYGVLPFSSDPQMHLDNAGLVDAVECVDQNSYLGIGRDCIRKYKDDMTFLNTISVLIREPAVIFRSIVFVFDSMQTSGAEHLGRYEIGDPRVENPGRFDAALNFMGEIQNRFFPRGIFLGFVLVIYLAWFLFCIWKKLAAEEISFLGLLLTLGCTADMFTAFLGDGKQDIQKHLYLSNILFVIMTILFVSSVINFSYDEVKKRINKNLELRNQNTWEN